MYQRQNRSMSTRAGYSSDAKRTYNSRVYMARGLRKDKEGHDVETVLMFSSGNFWYVNESKNGSLYGGFTLSGQYNIKSLSSFFQSVNEKAEKVNITLFFFDKDAEYIDKYMKDHDSMDKPFVCTLYEKQDKHGEVKICGQILRMM